MKNIHELDYNVDALDVNNLLSKGWTLTEKEIALVKVVVMKNIHGQVFNVDASDVSKLLAKGWTLAEEKNNNKKGSSNGKTKQ